MSVRTFDDDGKITQIDSAGLKTYSYDDAFRISRITDASDPALSWRYEYDDLDRLTSVSKTGTTLGYDYDENGNRRLQTGSGASTFVTDSSSNRLTSTSGALTRTYGYDDAGNTPSFDGITFTYNNRGRMKSSTKNGVTTNYTYNALGQLVKKGASALYYYDDAGHVLGIYNSSGSLTEEIVWLGDIPLATLRPKVAGGVDVYYIHSDHLNTPRVITDASSNDVRWRWDAEPFGGGAPNEDPNVIGAFVFSLRFPGQVFQAETGLNYNYFRDYDSGTGRYVQSDPIGLAGGSNTYAYVRGNPNSLLDPNGLEGIGPWTFPPGPDRDAYLGSRRKTCDCTKILTYAQAALGSTEWAFQTRNGDFAPNSNKCNLFVCDAISSALGFCPRRRGGLGGPLSVGEWASNRDIPNFPIVHSPLPGDVVAVAFPYSNASGHMGIVSGPSSSIYAGGHSVEESGWPWDPSKKPQGTPVFRRCQCE